VVGAVFPLSAVTARKSAVLLLFSLGADVQIQCCQEKVQIPHLCIFSTQIQYKCNMEAPVFESAHTSCYFTRYFFFPGNFFVLQAQRTDAPI
jgi:hypothetical protein